MGWETGGWLAGLVLAVCWQGGTAGVLLLALRRCNHRCLPASQDERAVELLLQAGADPTLSSGAMAPGATCLSVVAAQGKARLLRLLLQGGRMAAAVSQAEEEQGFTPLMLAARRGSKECVQLLLEAGADQQARTTGGKTAQDLAAVNKRAAVLELLQAGGSGGGGSTG